LEVCFMKQNVRNGAILLAAMVVLLFFAGCPQEVTELSSSAEIASLTVAGKQVTLGAPSDNWLTAKEAANTGSVYLSATEMTSAEVVVNKGQDGQTVYLAAAKPEVMPDFLEGTTKFDFASQDYLWVEVFSENHDAYNLYAIQVRTSTPTVLDIAYGGRSAEGGVLPNGEPIQKYGNGVGTPGATIAAAVEGEVWFGDNQTSTALELAITTEDPATTVLAAVGSVGASETALFPANYVNPTPFEFTPVNGNYLYLKSKSGDSQGDTVYYKIKLVQKATDLTIGNVTIQGNSAAAVSFDVGTMGTNGFGGGENHADGALLGADGFKNILSSAPPANVTVDIGTKPSGAAFRYGHTDFFNAQENVPSAGHITLTYQESNVLTEVKAGEYIAIEVTNELGDKGWYAFRVGIGHNSDITNLTVNGESITLTDARNTSAAGTTFAEYRPVTSPADTNTDGFWDSLVVAAPGSSAPAEILIAIADTVDAAIAEEDWETVSSGSHTFTDILSTAKFIIIRVKNQDTLDYYYKVRALYGESGAVITGVTVGGVTASSIGSPGSEVLFFGAMYMIQGHTPGAVTLTAPQAADPATVTVVALGASTNATMEYGVGVPFYGNLTTPSPWPSTGSGLFSGPNALPINGASVLIKVTSEDKGTQNVYVIVSTVE
jgi:hypothetical protein